MTRKGAPSSTMYSRAGGVVVPVMRDAPVITIRVEASPPPPPPPPAPEPVQPPLLELEPPPMPAEKAASLNARIAAITDEAIAAFNAILGKPNGLLPRVTGVGIEKRRDQVKRCLKVASDICNEQYGCPKVTPQFWEQYFATVDQDAFRSGRGPYTGDHMNWRPTFEYLTRPRTMLEVFERAVADYD